MPDGIGYPQTQPVQPSGGNQGLDQILQALAIGGQPLGEIANMQSPLTAGIPQANSQANPQANPIQGQIGNVMDQLTPDQLQLIMEALSQQGIFNNAPNTGA